MFILAPEFTFCSIETSPVFSSTLRNLSILNSSTEEAVLVFSVNSLPPRTAALASKFSFEEDPDMLIIPFAVTRPQKVSKSFARYSVIIDRLPV